jgi:outer membrane scaffolding protein for murein synthesis (MipA/OmpV family)
LSALLLCFNLAANADDDTDDEKVWELGVGLGGQYLPDYRGSSHSRALVLPFPMLRYNGEYLKADEDGIRSELVLSEKLRLDVSAESALVIGADDNTAREGMPELLPGFQIGPSLIAELNEQWSLHLPVRLVAASDLSRFDNAGWVFNPYLQYHWQPPNKWQYKLRLGLLWGNEDYHEYYYGVAQRYQTTQRAAYDAKEGYSGTVMLLSIRRRVGQWWFGGTLRYDNLQGSEMRDSPLLERDHSAALTFGAGWFFQ